MRDNHSALQTWQEVDVLIVYFTETAAENEIQCPNEARLCIIENVSPHQLETQNTPPGDKL